MPARLIWLDFRERKETGGVGGGQKAGGEKEDKLQDGWWLQEGGKEGGFELETNEMMERVNEEESDTHTYTHTYTESLTACWDESVLWKSNDHLLR